MPIRLPRPLAWLITACFLLAFALPTAVQAQSGIEPPTYQIQTAHFSIAPRDVCVLHPGEPLEASQLYNQLRTPPKQYQTSATFVVNYQGFDGAEGQEAREAFQRAVDIWAQHLSSPVTIRVRASFASLGQGVLGSAGSNQLWFLIEGDDQVDCNDNAVNDVCTLYGDALADAVLGEDLGNGQPDIVANFSNEAPWYYGTGTPPPGQFDFTAVVLHELGHGLGFFGSMNGSGGTGVWPYNASNPDVPVIYDRFAEDASGTMLINTDVYPNPSTQLGNALTTGRVFFDGPVTLVANDGERPELFTPSSWNQGSSYSHLDEATYPAGTPNALMSPQIAPQEVFSGPGAITCGMFRDMGWPLGAACQALIQIDLENFEAVALDDGDVRAAWVTTPESNKERFVLQRSAFGGPYEDVVTFTLADGVPGQDGRLSFTYIDSEVGAGEYTYRLLLIDEQDPSDVVTTLPQDVKIFLLGDDPLVAENTGDLSTELVFTLPPPTPGFRYGDLRVERCVGTATDCAEGPFEAMLTETAQAGTQRITAPLLGPGTYVFRLSLDVIDESSGETNTVTSVREVVEVELEGDFAVSTVFPNPATDRATVTFTVRVRQGVTVSVYNAMGRLMQREALMASPLQAQLVTLDGSDLASGVYFVQIIGDRFTAERKLVMVR